MQKQKLIITQVRHLPDLFVEKTEPDYKLSNYRCSSVPDMHIEHVSVLFSVCIFSVLKSAVTTLLLHQLIYTAHLFILHVAATFFNCIYIYFLH